MGRLIRFPDVRLDFGDAGDPPSRLVITDEMGPKQRAGRLERGTREDRSIEDVQA